MRQIADMKGTFELKTPQDLLQKLRCDVEQLEKDPINTYLAFNFFVTAEHMKDWLYPGKINRTRRKELEKSSTLLQICSHVANGAKHFQVEASHHHSVSTTVKTGGYWPENYWPAGYWGRGYWPKGALVIELKNVAKQQLGPSITALDLAQRILSFWEKRPEFAKL